MFNHESLFDRLRNDFGIDGKVLAWLKSYLSSRQQFVKIGQHNPIPPLANAGYRRDPYSVPFSFLFTHHRSAKLCPGLACTFTCLPTICRYLALSDTNNNLVILDQCTNDVKAWYLQNDLLFNVNIAGTSLPVTEEIKLLGMILDSRLNLDSHVRAVCKSC